MIERLKSNPYINKETKNMGWLIAGKVSKMMLSFIVSIFTTRYLGPSNYGLINYVAAYTTFFLSICTLGLETVLLRDFVEHPEDEGKTIGTTLILRAAAGLLSAFMIVGIISVVDQEDPLLIPVAILSSISLIFDAFNVFHTWFQSRYQSKVTAVVALVSYSITSAYKISLLVMGKDIRWFAFSNTVDGITIAIMLVWCYRRESKAKLTFSSKKAKRLLSDSYHYILSGLIVAIYSQTDRLMLKQLQGETVVGYYSLAYTVNMMWVFVLTSIIDSLFPTILRLHREDEGAFKRKNKQLYALIIYLSLFVAIVMCTLGRPAIKLIYGPAYEKATLPLAILSFFTLFYYLGVARNVWTVCENKQRYLKYMYMVAVVLNILLNAALIPSMGASGAAIATLVTQIIVVIILPLFMKSLRPNAMLIIDAFLLKGVFTRRRTGAKTKSTRIRRRKDGAAIDPQELMEGAEVEDLECESLSMQNGEIPEAVVIGDGLEHVYTERSDEGAPSNEAGSSETDLSAKVEVASDAAGSPSQADQSKMVSSPVNVARKGSDDGAGD